MGLIIRHAGSPYIDGEELIGSDLEQDVARATQEISGNIENINIASDADLNVAEIFADSTIRGNRVRSNTLAVTKIADDAVLEDKIIPDALQTAKMAAGSLTSSALVEDTANQAITAIFTAIAAVNRTTSATSQGVLVMCFGIVTSVSPNTAQFDIRLRRDTTVLRAESYFEQLDTTNGAKMPFFIKTVDTSVAVSTFYEFNCQARVTTGTGTVIDAIIIAVDLAR